MVAVVAVGVNTYKGLMAQVPLFKLVPSIVHTAGVPAE